MKDKVRINGDAIRKASRATAFLQLFAVGLLVGLVYLFMGIYEKYQALQDGVRENALWSVYQLDREARRLDQVLDETIAAAAWTPAASKNIALRYDILYSRMAVLEKTDFDLRFKSDKTLADQVEKVRGAVAAMTPWFDELDAGRGDVETSVDQIATKIDDVTAYTSDLLIYTNNKVSSDRADARDAVQSLLLKSGILVGLLAISVAVLIFTLRRQLHSVRAAGLVFETMANELNDAYRSAEAGNRAKSQFMATMGHEVRTPLNAILGTAELLSLCELPERVATGLQTIRRSGQSLLEVLNEILDFAKIENGRIEIDNQAVDLRGLVESVLETMRDRASERGDTLELDMASQLSFPAIRTDPTRLRQVLLNLISNAIKFTANGTVTLRLSQPENAPDRLLIEVQDTGIGIDEAGLGKLFRPFSQVDSSISRKYGGTGLGLTISKQIVESLGGSIGVNSSKGAGSTFWFELPIVAAELPVETGLEVKHEPAAGIGLPRLRILLAEDNKINQQVASGLLAYLDQSVRIANDGLEAVAAVASEEFDLVLMDMQMPNLDGIDAARRIRALGGAAATVPIIAMTANASDNDRILCGQAGMTGFQSKPISIAKLRDILRPFADASAGSRPVDGPDAAFLSRRQEIVDAIGEESFQELIDQFFEDAARAVADLSVALAERRHGDIDHLLHTIKGAAGSVGLHDVAEFAQASRHPDIHKHDVDMLQRAIDQHRQRLAA